jgi:predicted dienelactone hydrolase
MSHGAGAWGGQFTFLGESLASHGYVVAAPYHRTDTPSLRADEILQVVGAMLARSNSADDKLHRLIDPNSIALGGYSRGGITTSESLS